MTPWKRCRSSIRPVLGASLAMGVVILLAPSRATRGSTPASPVVSHLKVVSDKVQDVSSLDAWRASFIDGAMTDEQKALAIWRSVVMFRHQSTPPNEYLHYWSNVHDAIKTFNVYGYGQCCCASADVESLARYLGLSARGRQLNGHEVPELFTSSAWHMLDASLIDYFPRSDGSLAGVDEINSGIMAWYAANPSYQNDLAALKAFQQSQGWRNGPPVLSLCPLFDANGFLPAGQQSWATLMQVYDRSTPFSVLDFDFSQGYEVNVQLRPGERLVRNWSNKGLYVDMDDGRACPTLASVPGKGDMAYSPSYGDLAPGRVGNGTAEYQVPLSTGAFRSGAIEVTNVATTADDGQAPAVHCADATQPATFVLRMPTSYVYLTGRISGTAVVPPGGSVGFEISRNNGLDWTPVGTVTTTGPFSLDVGTMLIRHYDYRLRVTISGRRAGLDALDLFHDVQHSQRALPALAAGTNTITLSADTTAQGTVTIEGSLDPNQASRQLVFTDYHPVLDPPNCIVTPEINLAVPGSVTFPIRTPGDMTGLRMGGAYRAKNANDGWDYLVSFDDGVTWTKLGRAAGPTPGNTLYVTTTAIPPGRRSALVRFAGVPYNTTELFDLRIDADYVEPFGGFAPVVVTYRWSENGVARSDVHTMTSPNETYTIACASTPLMVSLTVEQAGEVTSLPSPSPSPTASPSPNASPSPSVSPSPSPSPSPSSPPIVVDNGTPGFSVTSGSWSLHYNPHRYGSTDLLVGTGGGSCQWKPTLTSGVYAVYAWWPSRTSPATATFTIQTASGPVSVAVDQAPSGSWGVWNSLGTFTLDASTAAVTITAAAGQNVAADAVEFVPVGP